MKWPFFCYFVPDCTFERRPTQALEENETLSNNPFTLG